METITFKIDKSKARELEKLALRFGLSIESLTSKIISNVTSDISEESWSDYTASSKASFKKGLSDLKAGRTFSSL
jgi:hypothetical protein